MIAETRSANRGAASLRSDFEQVWRGTPDKGLFFGLLAAWVVLFHFLGNSTFGYTKTGSLFGWLSYCYKATADDEHGFLIPFVVLGLFWWKREQLLSAPKRHWWPGLLLLAFGLLLHATGFMVQQPRVSTIAFFIGLYGLTGLTWGPQWLRASFFPFFLFIFCLPLSAVAETVTFPLRLLATRITSTICHVVLGINVIQDGTRIFDANGAYQYEVAAACSGIRSLTAIFALTTIYGFTTFKSLWRTLLVIASAFPLAVAANVLRLTSIIVASEVFNPAAGKLVHESGWISLLPYVPAIIGMLFLGHWLRENRLPRQTAQASVMSAPAHPL